jgi:hypothetical protein
MSDEQYQHIKAKLPKDLALLAEHAKVDMNLTWSAFIRLAVIELLESRKVWASSDCGFAAVAAALDEET